MTLPPGCTSEERSSRTRCRRSTARPTAYVYAYAYAYDDRPTGQTVDGVATAISYDANGSLASQTGPAGTREFDYGLDANLRAVELEDSQTIGYGYDEAGNRVNRTVDAVLDASWSWDTLGLPTRLDERDGTDTLTHQWWTDPLTDLGGALADTAAGTPAWLLGDHQGSITGVADATTLTGSGDLDPYGSPTGADTGDYADNPLRFHGQYLDHTTGLYDVRARDYDAATGRFTSPDPATAAAGTAFTQTYHYGYNRPTVLTDPTGQCPIICTAIIGGVAGAAVGGIDCWLSGDDRNTCLTKIAVGAAAGALTGATLGAGGSAAAGLYGGVSTGTQIAGGIVAGGAGSVLYGSGVAAATGQPYSYGNAANDFLWGAAGSAGGVAAGTVAQRAAARTAGFQAANCPAPNSVGAVGRPYIGRTANELIDVNIKDPAAQALAVRIHGRASVRFSGDPKGREFDAVSHLYVAQSKPANYQIGSSFRRQAQATFEMAIQTGRRPYFHFEGPPMPEVTRKLQEYGVRYGIQPVIDTRRLGG
ncbi:RHS repeat-associated core domain-containing protein [Solwaraspora sp. WMMA2101]|uniref:RHS repeat-associated core domain-containing protein n=1 Tax=Solwaraspora sp. WMMA2101 TaxID=3404124 RepID=UPI003B9643A2